MKQVGWDGVCLTNGATVAASQCSLPLTLDLPLKLPLSLSGSRGPDAEPIVGRYPVGIRDEVVILAPRRVDLRCIESSAQAATTLPCGRGVEGLGLDADRLCTSVANELIDHDCALTIRIRNLMAAFF